MSVSVVSLVVEVHSCSQLLKPTVPSQSGAMLTVLRDIFPTAVIKCCRFHLGQAWWRKTQNLGLSRDYKDTKSDIGQWLRLSIGLHFIDLTDVEDCFVEELMTRTSE